MQTISSTIDTFQRKYILNRLSDVSGGISLVLSTLIAGNVLPEGTPVSVPSSGKRTVCKQAVVLTGTTTTVIKVTTGEHNFKVGDFLCSKEGGIAYAITDITTTSGVDDITVGTAIELVAAGGYVYEAAAESAATDSAFKNIPNAILKNALTIPTAANVVYQKADALLHAVVAEGALGPLYLAYLKGVVEAKY